MQFDDICDLLENGFAVNLQDFKMAQLDIHEVGTLMAAFPQEMACMIKYKMSRMPFAEKLKLQFPHLKTFYD